MPEEEELVNCWNDRNGKVRLILQEQEEDGNGQWFWHLHHEKLFEKANEPIQNRIDYIKANKDNVELRLKLMKPIKGPLPEGFEEMYNMYANRTDVVWLSPEMERLHKKECPDCPWNGKSILGGK